MIITCLNRMTISVIKTAINMGPVWLFRLGKTGVNKKSTDWVIGKCECQWHHHKYFHYLQRKLTLANICLYVIYGVVRNSVFSSQMNVYHMPAPLLLFEWKAKSSSKKLFNTWMIKLYSQIMVLIYQYLWQKKNGNQRNSLENQEVQIIDVQNNVSSLL